LVLCVFVQRAVSAFVLGTAAVAEGRVRNVERHGRVVGGVMNALGMRPAQTPAAHAAAAAAAAARGLEERNGGKHNRHGSGRHHKRH
jgi:hypothetical protein